MYNDEEEGPCRILFDELDEPERVFILLGFGHAGSGIKNLE